MNTFSKIIVSIDPAATANDHSDETGIIVMAKTHTGQGIILADLSGKYSPQDWAQRAVEAYKHYRAHLIVAEVNQGGDMIEHTLRTIDPHIRFKPLRARSGKYERAVPVSALYRQGKIVHAQKFTQLEDQLLSLSVKSRKSPDRADALVWGIRELFFEKVSQMTLGMEYV
jgi:phage terminase large subunit-like protein